MKRCTVSPRCGAICGTETENARIFRGIPYANTPRFAPPQPVPVWDTPLDAVGPELDCPQYGTFRDESAADDTFYYREFRSDATFCYREDVMTLNITTPLSAENCPVVVFIHGGGHETGTVGELPYGPSLAYAARGVILVSIGYRLNIFSLYEAQNYGLLDQIAAVRWVHENIAAFGGDASRVILMGQSAGAMSIMDLCYSQTLKGLVHGAVLMSGGGMVPKLFGPWTKEKSADFWAAVRARAGAKTEADMKTLPAETIWNAWYAESRARNDLHLLQPGIDGTVIPDVPQTVVKRGQSLDIPMIVGVTSQDFMPAVIYEMALGWALGAAKAGRSPVFGYLFDRALPGGSFKAFHACDLWYMFGNMEKSWRPFEAADRALSAQMIDSVVNFARTGDPNGDNLPPWPAVTAHQKAFRRFDVAGETLALPFSCRRKMLRTFLKDKGPM